MISVVGRARLDRVAVVVFEERRHDGRRMLVRAAAAALATLYVVGFGGEEVVFALANPEAVVRSRLVAYLLSAGLIGTGFSCWGWRNWESFRPAGLGDAL